MNFAGSAARLEIVQEENALTFRSIPERRWVDFITPIVIAIGALAGGRILYYAIGVGAILWWSVYWLKGTPDELWVTDTQLVSSKNGVIR